MSVESLSIALHHSRAKGSARLVLLGIANHDGDGGAWPAVATLARYAGGLDRRSVQRALEKLEELGEIRRTMRGGGMAETPDHLRPNLYHFMLTCPPHCDRSRNHRDSRKPLITFKDEELLTGVASTPRGGVDATGGVASTPPEPSFNPKPQVNSAPYVPNRARGGCGHELVDDRHCVFGCLPESINA